MMKGVRAALVMKGARVALASTRDGACRLAGQAPSAPRGAPGRGVRGLAPGEAECSPGLTQLAEATFPGLDATIHLGAGADDLLGDLHQIGGHLLGLATVR